MASVEKVVEQSLLYDYYGELLTEHQRRIYEAAVFENLSLGEIAEESGISRQGVHDLLRRCDAKLTQYEERLHLLEKHEKNRTLCESIEKAAAELKSMYHMQETDRQVKPVNGDETTDCSLSCEENAGDEKQTLDFLLAQIRQLLEEI